MSKGGDGHAVRLLVAVVEFSVGLVRFLVYFVNLNA